MQSVQPIPVSVVHEIRDQCLCFAAQRAARGLARRFDRVFQPLGLTNGQFSLMVALTALRAPRLGVLADLLAMDQTTLTAAIKALEGRGLVQRRADPDDQRARLVSLTEAGHGVLNQAVPLWRAEIAALQASYGADRAAQLIDGLRALGPMPVAAAAASPVTAPAASPVTAPAASPVTA